MTTPSQSETLKSILTNDTIAQLTTAIKDAIFSASNTISSYAPDVWKAMILYIQVNAGAYVFLSLFLSGLTIILGTLLYKKWNIVDDEINIVGTIVILMLGCLSVIIFMNHIVTLLIPEAAMIYNLIIAALKGIGMKLPIIR